MAVKNIIARALVGFGLIVVSLSVSADLEPSKFEQVEIVPVVAPEVVKQFEPAIKSSGFSPEHAAIKAGGGLLLMVSVLFGLAYIAKRKGLMAANHVRKLKLRETLNLGAKEKLVLVDFAGETLVIGVTAHNIRLVRSAKKSDIDDFESNPDLGAKNAFDFQAKLNDFLMKGAR